MPRTYLFIHQNFPAQFVHVATALVRRGEVVHALSIGGHDLRGVVHHRYTVTSGPPAWALPGARDLLVKLARGHACLQAMKALLAEGLRPDVIVAHPGWGEALFCRDVWPDARLVIYSEFYYAAEGADVGFDPEFDRPAGPDARAALRLKNVALLQALAEADAVYTPTGWQRSQVPALFRDKVRVAFDGIDTAAAAPDPAASISLQRAGVSLKHGDEVITFVNRNFEPYRGFHVFMRALPEILRRRSQARCVLVGRDGVSYGTPPPGGGSWRDHMLRELAGQLPMDRIHFLGGLSHADYVRVLQVSACHVYLTYPFVLSWSCLEAMAVECPLVASNTAPVREVVTHAHNGLLVDFLDQARLCDAVERVLADRELAGRLGRQAREDVVSRFELSKCVDDQLRVIESG